MGNVSKTRSLIHNALVIIVCVARITEAPYWWETVAFPAGEAQPPAGAVDLAIVGSGITGLTAALTAAKRGAKVAVLEAQALGWGASSRNGGQVLTGLKVGAGDLFARYGRELTRRLFAASVQAIDEVAALVSEEGIACDFVRSGHLEVAARRSHVAGLEQTVAVLAEQFDHPTRLIAAKDLPGEIGSPIYHAGLMDEASAILNPARYTAGLVEAARRYGARLFAHTPVERIAREGTRWRVITARGTLLARDVFVASSGYTGPVTPDLRKRLVPIGSYMVATEPLAADVQQQVLPTRRAVFDTNNFLHYYRLAADGRLLFGGRAGFYPESAQTVRESAGILQTDLRRVFPHLRAAAITHVWGGTLDFAFDLMPHAGRLTRGPHAGLHFALAYAGHGVSLATYLGARMGAQLIGEPVDNPFAEVNFPGAPLGLYNGTPWFLPAAQAWFRFLDRLG
jgi:glycine/D-amino acid oxidase-like deaminating enzyme